MNEFIKKNICLITQTLLFSKKKITKKCNVVSSNKMIVASEIQQHIKCGAKEKCTFV
jgi:homoserine dehydrogenase